MYSQHLLGFDARQSLANSTLLTSPIYNSQRFLRPVTLPICSLSLEIWHSLFGSVADTEPGRIYLEEHPLLSVPKPDWIGPGSRYWSDLKEMYHQLIAYNSILHYPFEVIALTWITYREPAKRRTDPGPYLEPTIPSRKDPSWNLLGYDVADGFKWSALTWYHSERELQELRRKFGPRLNSLHLFRKRKDALQYCSFINQEMRDSRHIFQVYGIWRVATIKSYEDLVLQQSMVKN